MVLFCKVCQDCCNEASPKFVEGVVQTDRPFVAKIKCILLLWFMGEDCLGFLPVRGCSACYPEAYEEVMYGRV